MGGDGGGGRWFGEVKEVVNVELRTSNVERRREENGGRRSELTAEARRARSWDDETETGVLGGFTSDDC